MSDRAVSPVWRQLRKHKLAMVSFGIVSALTVVCMAAPLIAPYSFDAIDLGSIRQAPSWSHWMGTDDLGRDLFTRVLFGGRISLAIGILAALIGTGLGSLIGATAGFYGGRTDNLLMRLTDVVYSIPTLPILIVLSSYSQAVVSSMALIIGLLSWMATARVVRGEVLAIKERTYVEAARGLGATNLRLIVRHILPNAIGPIVGSFAVIILFFVLGNLPFEFFENLRPWLFTTYTDVWRKAFDNTVDLATIGEDLLALTAFLAVFLVAAWAIFRRKDILS